MTDVELLEAAAKAHGGLARIGGSPDWSFFSDGPEMRRWSPLEDDGDALRLAAKLYLWEAVRLAHRLVGEPGCPDIYAATRRAIVRAAAEIGKMA